MAYIRKTLKGYRAEIEIQGVRKSASFVTKREALLWVAKEETAIREDSKTAPAHKYTLKDALVKYRDEVSPDNAGSRWEQIRIDAFLAHPEWLPLSKKIGLINPTDFENFSKERSKTVKDGTILRELGMLSGVMETARLRWQWVKENPVRDSKKPKEPPSRKRLITRPEIKAILRGLDYSPIAPHINSLTQSIAVCFLLALRTGMRAGDMTGLHWSNVKPRHLVIEIDKIGRRTGMGRDVPLSKKAVRIVNKMRGFDKESVFSLKPQTLDARFRTIRERQGLSGFTFHDTRHTAATWMAGKFKSNKDVTAQQAIFDMCKIFGWTDPKRALEYYNPNPEDVASRLD